MVESNVQNQPRTKSGYQSPQDMQPTTDIVHYLKQYARERPDVAALWCFGVGFVLGWKIKPW